MIPSRSLLCGALAIAAIAGGQCNAAPVAARPIVIAHRGASGYLPEETLAAYRLAISMGADFIEPDLFLTSDGVLVARHDRSLELTTDVAAVAAREPGLAAKAVSGNYFVDQLTHADIRKLNARSRASPGFATPGNGYYDGMERFPVATFAQVLDLAYDTYKTSGRVVGVYPEVKTIPATFPGAAEYHRAIADAMLTALAEPRYQGFFDGRFRNVFLQSFDAAVVRYLHGRTTLPVVFLTTCPATAEVAQEIAAFADGIGLGVGSSNAACVERAHAAGLQVHVYTLYDDASRYEAVYGWGVDGIFGNHPDVNKRVRDALYPPR